MTTQSSTVVASGQELDYSNVFEELRSAFATGRTRPQAWRVAQLKAIRALVVEKEKDLCDALYADLGKPVFEAYTAEMAFIRSEVDHACKHLGKWMKPRRTSTPLVYQPGKSWVQPEPLGVTLVMGAWNYPVQLCLGPMVDALAAGNCVLLKPSEVSPHTASALAALVPQYLDTSCVKVVEGGVAESTALLKLPWDHIFYTGNGAIAKIVMTAAAQHLTPVTLELGGKSPTVVDRDANLKVTAKRIVWGKFYNAGQTCIAPDYILVHKDVQDAFLEQMKAAITEFFGADPKQSADFARIVNARHHNRLCKLMAGADVAVGGQADADTRYIAPTLLKNITPDSPVMQEEIFGPILPVLPVNSMEEAVKFINARPKPLALYVFTGNSATENLILHNTTSGGLLINHVLMHVGNQNLPFGGVGPSGMGAYHGKTGFDNLSHLKPVMKKPTFIDPPVAYPPYTASKMKQVRFLMK